MPYLRFSIRTLLGLVAFISVTIVAVPNANPLWASITLTLAVLGILVAVAT